MSFEPIDVKSLTLNPFVKIGKEWMLITAGDATCANTMTASWGGLGVLWGADVAFVFIRPQRYTHLFVEENERFSLSFFDGAYKKELGLLGTISGRESNKIAQAGLHIHAFDGVPAFEEAKLVLIARKMYRDAIKGECFIDTQADALHYPQKDYHTMYIACIEKAYVQKD